MNETIVKLPNAIIKYRSDGIIHVHYLENLINLQESKEIFYTIREHSPWEVSPLFISGETFTSLDKEAKVFFAGEEVLKHCSCVAVLVKNIGQKLLTNFYFKLIKTNTPTRFFSSESEAIIWAIKYSANNILKTRIVGK